MILTHKLKTKALRSLLCLGVLTLCIGRETTQQPDTRELFAGFSSIRSVEAKKLEVVATSSYQWTGVAVSQDNRLFVNFPTWSNYPSFKVAEVVGGKLKPYPNLEVNKEFICVQSVVADKRGNLWVVDAAKLRGQSVDPKGAQIYKVDLKTNTVSRVYTILPPAITPNSYLNDIRIDEKEAYAYLTDSDVGGIVVLNLKTGKAQRALDNTVAAVRSNLEGINFKTTGLWPKQAQSDGLELGPKDEELYFTALTGNILYSIPTKVLKNPNLTVKERAKEIKIVNKANVPTDGLTRIGNTLYMGNLPEEGIWKVDLKTRKGSRVPLREAIRWADSFSVDSKGNLYFTASQINYKDAERETFKLYKLSF